MNRYELMRTVDMTTIPLKHAKLLIMDRAMMN